MSDDDGERNGDTHPDGAGGADSGSDSPAVAGDSDAGATAGADGAAAAESDDVEGAGPADEPLAEEEAPVLPPEEIRATLEALIFAAPQPITPRQIGQVLGGIPQPAWKAAIEELKADYARTGRGLQLVEVAGGYQVTTRPEYNDWLRALLDPKSTTRLSIQALETLAVIAYKQPVTQPEVIELRGVKSGGVLKTLLEKRLIRIVGRKEVVGRPMLYGTTRHFLLHFGLKDLGELPKIEEFAEVLGEEVDIAGLRRAIDAPRPVEIPLSEEDAGEGTTRAEGERWGEAAAGVDPSSSDT